MKKLIILAISIAGLVLVINSCKKTGGNINPLSDIKNLTVGSYLVLDSTINLNFDNTAMATSTVGITVSGYKNGEAVDHIDIYAASGSTYDTTQWHKVKTVSYTGKGTKLTVSGTELSAALGVSTTSYTPGSYYTFYNRLFTKSGKQYDVNNTGNNSGSGLVTGPYYYGAFYFTTYIVCPFTGGMTGTYKVIVDDWADWSAGATVQVTDGPGANQINLSQVYPGGGTVINPLVVNVDPTTGTASIPKVTFGRYGGPSSTQYTAEGTGANDVAGYVFSCTGYITLTIDFQGGGTDYGPNRLILQKQ
ncbi:MAG: hypothetical protein BGO55_15580 [Sphingobacteriales bacterium 50-39]|nr:hypothetical protein [Sphingobacteriales bacterium]OJW54788.1 MAG: hypothetical protein BGO55_15580 [Sphingobacteriales bacterium 50-39]